MKYDNITKALKRQKKPYRISKKIPLEFLFICIGNVKNCMNIFSKRSIKSVESDNSKRLMDPSE